MVIGTNIIEHKLAPYLQGLACDAIYLLIDECLQQFHPSKLETLQALTSPERALSLEVSEPMKSLSTLEKLWQWLSDARASRSSILVIVGGGVLTDIGALAAATYMRGIRVVHVPTTILGMVDASIGGKSAIDFAGVKNLIGAFHHPLEIFIDTDFIDTLPLEELYSGYAEVIKYGMLIGGDLWRNILRLGDPQMLSSDEWQQLIGQCACYKESIVAQDPHESGLRRVLNLGHTIGHALEAYSIASPKHRHLTHGEAVIVGLIVETYIGVLRLGGSRDLLRSLVYLARELYPQFVYVCRDYPALLKLMRQDKKANQHEIVMMIALEAGHIEELRLTDDKAIKEGLDFYRETFGG